MTDGSYICSHRIPCAEHGRHDVLCRKSKSHKGDHAPIECGPWTYHWREDPLLKDDAERWYQEVAIPAQIAAGLTPARRRRKAGA